MDSQQPQTTGPIPPSSPNTQQSTQHQGPANLGMFERRIGRIGFLLGSIYATAIIIFPFILQLIVRFFIANDSAENINSNIADSASTSPLLTAINIISIIVGIVGAVLIIPIFISLYVRRLHDLNQSGVLTLLILVPIVSTLFFLYLLFVEGTKGSNQYGPPINSNKFLVLLGLKKPVS